MRQPTDVKTIDGPIASLGTYIDLELALSDVLADRLRRTSSSARALARRLADALRGHPGTERIAMTLHRVNGLGGRPDGEDPRPKAWDGIGRPSAAPNPRAQS